MKIAYLHYTPVGIPTNHFYYHGWKTALEDHEVEEKDCVLKSLQESDGEFDICFVSPGFVELGKHLYKKSSNTKYILVLEEDMHQSVEMLRCVASYYDYVFLFSEINFFCLRQMGVKNVRCILPCYDPEIFNSVYIKKKFKLSFLGQFDYLFDICGNTREKYCLELEKYYYHDAFIGRGFYAEQANQIYNESFIAFDLPIMSVVGPRSFSIGATTALLMLPSTPKPTLWLDNFRSGEDYISFDGLESLKEKVDYMIERPEECLRISQNMNKKMLKHTYKERFKEILDLVFYR